MRQRFATRLAAVQALYQMEQTGDSSKTAIYELKQGHIGLDDDETALPNADPIFFSTIINGVIDHQTRIDSIIENKLAKGWSMSRLYTTSRAILRAAIGEMIVCPEQNTAIILDEYVSIAGAFFADTETNFINAVLSAAVSEARPQPEQG